MEQEKRGGITDLVLVKETDQPSVALTYLDVANLSNSKNSNPAEVGLTVFTKFIQLETYKATSSMARELQDIQAIPGIDTEAMLKSVPSNEMEQTISKEITSTIYGLGEMSMLSDRTKFQKWANKWFGYEPKKYLGVIDTPDFVRKLGTLVISRSNMIAAKCRRGPANFILTGPQMGSMLIDHGAFQMAPLGSDNSGYNRGAQPYYAGSFAGMDLYIDPYMRWSDKRILLGRKTTDPSQPGVIYIKGKRSTELIADSASMAPKVTLEQRAAIVAYGSAQSAFYMIEIADKKHNLFTHILDRIKTKLNQLKKSK